MAWPQKGKWSEEQTQVTFNPGLLSGDKNDAWSPKIGLVLPACYLGPSSVLYIMLEKMRISFLLKTSSYHDTATFAGYLSFSWFPDPWAKALD